MWEYFWLAAAFIILLALIWRPFRRGVLGALDARSERIRKELDEAQRLHEEAKTLLARYQRQLVAEAIRYNAGQQIPGSLPQEKDRRVNSDDPIWYRPSLHTHHRNEACAHGAQDQQHPSDQVRTKVGVACQNSPCA